jgi:RNA polymerase sigma factor (sigma-70 family)
MIRAEYGRRWRTSADLPARNSLTRAERDALFAQWNGWFWRLARFYGKLYRLDFDEVYAEGACHAVRRFHRYDPTACAFSTWVKFVVARIARQMRERQRARANVSVQLTATLGGRDGTTLREPLANGPTVEDDCPSRNELPPSILTALDKLPPKQRTAVVHRLGLFGEEPKRWDEIDTALSPVRVKSLYSEGLRNVRAILDGAEPPRRVRIDPPKCPHCKRRPASPSHRGQRGLCRPCYDDPAVRALFPPLCAVRTLR